MFRSESLAILFFILALLNSWALYYFAEFIGFDVDDLAVGRFITHVEFLLGLKAGLMICVGLG